jgi:sugar phosphate isomerase/epimerase
LTVVSEIPADRVHYVHVCDAPTEIPADADGRRRIARAERLFPGEGGIDIAGVLQRLPKGILCAVEIQNPARSAAMGAEAYARMALEKTSRCLSAHFAG